MSNMTLDEALSILAWTANKNHLACVKHHVAALRARVEKLEGELARLSNTVELVKHGLNGPWEPGGDVAALAKEAGEALQGIGLQRGVGDWSMYRELPVKVEAIQRRATRAEAEIASWRDALMCVEQGQAITTHTPGVVPWTMMPAAMDSERGTALERAEARVEKLREALENIRKHWLYAGGALAEYSPITKMCNKALEEGEHGR